MEKPNRFVAPIIIAGITVGFLVSAYKFVVAKSNTGKTTPTANMQQSSPATPTSNPSQQ